MVIAHLGWGIDESCLNLVEGEMNEYLGGYFDDMRIFCYRGRDTHRRLGRVS